MARDVKARLSVRCCGDVHKIGLRPDGTFILYNHTPEELRLWGLMVELGAEPPLCMQFYRDEEYGTPQAPTTVAQARLKDKTNTRFWRLYDTLRGRRMKVYIQRRDQKRFGGRLCKLAARTAAFFAVKHEAVPPPKTPRKITLPRWFPTYAIKAAFGLYRTWAYPTYVRGNRTGLAAGVLSRRRVKQLTVRHGERKKDLVYYLDLTVRPGVLLNARKRRI